MGASPRFKIFDNCDNYVGSVKLPFDGLRMLQQAWTLRDGHSKKTIIAERTADEPVPLVTDEWGVAEPLTNHQVRQWMLTVRDRFMARRAESWARQGLGYDRPSVGIEYDRGLFNHDPRMNSIGGQDDD